MPIDRYSVVSFPIFPDCMGIDAHGTAFFYKFKEETYLITNWHNLSGRNPETGQPLSPTSSCPQNISIPFHVKGKLGAFSDPVSFSLYSESGEAYWRQHAIHGQNVDVAILKLDIPPEAEIFPINEMPEIEDIVVEIGIELFVLGFPIKLFTGIFPIWKRATLASELDFNIDGLPKFLIDTATQKGMSGSPVIIRKNGPYRTANGDSVLSTGGATKFLGIYSGRCGSTKDNINDAQLGLVWRKSLIEEIITKGVPGTYELK